MTDQTLLSGIKKTNTVKLWMYVCVPLDTNVKLREQMKRDYYIELIDQLQRIYPTYKYAVIPLIIGALGTVRKTLKENLIQVGINKEETGDLVEKMQKKVLLGTLS